MAEPIKKTDVSTLVDMHEGIATAVTFPDGIGVTLDKSGLASPQPRTITLQSLQASIKHFEEKFSNNCNCLINNDCCQTCQSTTCQSTVCQSQYCQSCQSQKCQSCQSQCNYDCGDCSSH